jgi:hypothetical protein
MFVTRRLAHVGLVVALGAGSAFAVGCGGGSKGEAAHPVPKPGDMPEGGDWSGVFYNQLYGDLHMLKEGENIHGAWRTANGEKWGEMHGEANGNLFKFEWKETTIGMVGPSATRNGRGYFQYIRPPGDNVNDEIKGEWGLNSEQTGVPWTAVKQRNRNPDFKAVLPDETQKVQGTGNWDEEKKSGGGGGDDKKKGDDWE